MHVLNDPNSTFAMPQHFHIRPNLFRRILQHYCKCFSADQLAHLVLNLKTGFSFEYGKEVL